MRSAMKLTSAAVATALACLAPHPAAARTCAEKPVMARGEPSRFETLAKTSARANWRARVRATPALGPDYADFNKALGADYRCAQEASQMTCTAIAHPCKD